MHTWRIAIGVLFCSTIASCGTRDGVDGRGRDTVLDQHAPCGMQACRGKSARIASIRLLQHSGARPRWSPRGDLIVFDRKNDDGFYDVYLTDLHGRIAGSLTEGKAGIAQRHNGNAVFHPSGDFVVFVSETPMHYGMRMKWLGDPGLGLLSNLWATTPKGDRFWQLTDIPIKQSLRDRTSAMGVVNPHFSHDGSMLIWTERYAEGGNHNWGKWRLKTARFVTRNGRVRLEDERVLFVPPRGNYVTFVGELDRDHFLVAGNLDGQHEYGMDQYRLNPKTGRLINLQNSPQTWEEDACVSPSKRSFVFMSNAASRYPLDFNDPNWPAQPRERDYWIMNANGTNRERLTFFNDPSAPEYLGRRAIVAACDFSPNGRYLAGILGVDNGTAEKANIDLKLVLLEFKKPVQ